MTIRIALVGFGHIARHEHLPSIRANQDFRLAAVVTRGSDPDVGAPCFENIGTMLEQMPGEVDAVAICTPPEVRFAIACQAIAAGLGVLLEKPPCSTLGEILELERAARQACAPLYAAWHSQHAVGVEPAARVLAGHEVASLDIEWRENVRKWHSGQRWIWQAGGFGVFDTGVNALSIASRILPSTLVVDTARLLIPADAQSPIAAEVVFAGTDRGARFDWRETGPEKWAVSITTGSGLCVELHDGGASLTIDGVPQDLPKRPEYRSIYSHFALVQQERRVEVDAEPLRIVADAYLCGERETVDRFGVGAE
ncbi:Gfo/Idh/MocA family protein [Tsuneonella sp. HG249]